MAARNALSPPPTSKKMETLGVLVQRHAPKVLGKKGKLWQVFRRMLTDLIR